MWYIYIKEYSAIKREKTGSFAVLWMDLESFIQHEVGRKTSITYYHIYTESRKTVPMNLSTGQEQRHVWRMGLWTRQEGESGTDRE